MEITRIDTDRKKIEVKRIEISLSDHDDHEGFVITESFGELKIHKKSGDRISIFPCVSNEIYIK